MSQIETSHAITAAGEVTALADSPRILESITDCKCKSQLIFLFRPVLKFPMPEQILLDAATQAVLEGARFNPALTYIAEQGPFSSTHGNGQVPWTDEREVSEKLGVGRASHRFTSRRSRTVKSSAIR